jgi:hypothetical protein
MLSGVLLLWLARQQYDSRSEFPHIDHSADRSHQSSTESLTNLTSDSPSAKNTDDSSPSSDRTSKALTTRIRNQEVRWLTTPPERGSEVLQSITRKGDEGLTPGAFKRPIRFRQDACDQLMGCFPLASGNYPDTGWEGTDAFFFSWKNMDTNVSDFSRGIVVMESDGNIFTWTEWELERASKE